MKKKLAAMLLMIPFILCYVVTPAMALTWVTANQSTVSWDAVTQDVDGDPIPTGFHMEYNVYLANSATDPGKANPAKVGTTNQTQYTITLNTKGTYFVGVTSFLAEDATSQPVVPESNFAWSDNPADCKDGVDFGIRFFAAMAAPTNLRNVSTP